MSSPIDALRGVVNANQALPRVLTSGQPGPDHFRALKEAGVDVVIDIRDPMEPRGYDQQALMEELGFDYRVVVVNEGTLTDDTLDRMTEVMRETEGKDVLVHCASGNRVGGALIPYLIIDQRFTEEDATTAALRMGLRGAHLLEWGLSYARMRKR
jgi:protein tyrosine phosphatase (PTP) superfamily phosphohydrolase (DUF442 family)